MPSQFNAASYNFRHAFAFFNKEVLHWFPGHMGKGMRQMQQKLKSVDCVIEVHDARIPFSGRNSHFKQTICGVKPHILVLNKKDLTIPSLNPRVIEGLKDQQDVEHIIYTNSKDQRCKGIKSLTPLMVDLIKNSERYNRSEQREYNVMIIGVPNVGKSSLINMLRSRNMHRSHALRVGAVAGITRSVMMRMKIHEDPPIFMMDTPGILEPSVKNIEMGMKLALCASLQDHLVGEEIIADYLLYYMNKNGSFNYVDLMGLQEPCDDINKVLITAAIKYHKMRIAKSFDGSKMEVPDLVEASKLFIKAFRTGELGKLFLDNEFINTPNVQSSSLESYSR